ncbi:MAG TPA: cytochrome c [Stellaceae bacterium]|nr:cytochrome c [Stellaceae bacterium]
MTRRRTAAALLLAAAAVVIGAGAALPTGAAPDGAEPARIAQGRQLYAQHCSHCHGFNMASAGNVTYDLRTFPRDEQERFLDSVVNGKSGGMPPWGDVLTLDEIGEIWDYVRTGGKK